MAKHKYIETPERMWELFCEYRDEIKDNPIQIVEQRKGNLVIPKTFDGEIPNPIVHLPAQRPLTMEGFQNFLDDRDIISDVTDYFENKEERYSQYVRICSRIRRNIRQDQIEGGMAGIYNASITQRLNGLAENKKEDSTIIYKLVDDTRDSTDTDTETA